MKRFASLFFVSATVAACTGAHRTAKPISADVAVAPALPPVAMAVDGAWQKLATEPFKGKQDDIYFVDDKVGFYGNGSGKLFRTEDGGDSWKLVWEKPGTFIRALGFLDAKRGFIGNIGVDYFPGVTDTQMLYRTDDGGTTWTPVALPNTDGARGMCAIDILSVEFINHGVPGHREVITVGGRVGGPGAAFRSPDGGQTWERLALPADVAMILDIKFLDVNTGFIFAADDTDVEKSHGLIMRTTDSGRSWQPVYRSSRPFELMWKASFPSKRVGYATLQSYNEDPTTAQRYVVKTDDGGATWKELPLVNDLKVKTFGVGFVDDMTGWVGGVPTAFATTDGGTTWQPEAALGMAANKFRIVKSGNGAKVFAIGVDVNRVGVHPAPAPVPAPAPAPAK
jgi:photosystem II stability/assembly factor-like uncharacterized protein